MLHSLYRNGISGFFSILWHMLHFFWIQPFFTLVDVRFSDRIDLGDKFLWSLSSRRSLFSKNQNHSTENSGENHKKLEMWLNAKQSTTRADFVDDFRTLR
jgi:hypothetical protein